MHLQREATSVEWLVRGTFRRSQLIGIGQFLRLPRARHHHLVVSKKTKLASSQTLLGSVVFRFFVQIRRLGRRLFRFRLVVVRQIGKQGPLLRFGFASRGERFPPFRGAPQRPGGQELIARD